MADQPRQSDTSDATTATAPSRPLPASTPKPRRRWYQFSMRTLLVVMVVLCLCAAWVAFRLRQAEANRNRLANIQQAIDWIEEVGGRHDAIYTKPRSPTWLEQIFDDPGGIDDPAEVIVVSSVNLGRGSVRLLGRAKWEGSEIFFSSRIPFDPRPMFDNNPDPTRVTDVGLEKLMSLSNLTQLSLDETAVTDAGLAHLTGLKELEMLDLYKTQVTDVGLVHLKRLTNLRSLDLEDTRVTKGGVTELRRALPNCEIRD